jgi:hypothetical protein
LVFGGHHAYVEFENGAHSKQARIEYLRGNGSSEEVVVAATGEEGERAEMKNGPAELVQVGQKGVTNQAGTQVGVVGESNLFGRTPDRRRDPVKWNAKNRVPFPLDHMRVASADVEGLLVVATFTDTGGAEALGNYTATVDFGDGTSTVPGTITFANGTFTVTASHTFANQGTYAITTTIQDEGGSQATVTSTTEVGWIAGVYLDLLHRPVDPTGPAAWNALLNQGLARQQIVADIESSVEYRTDEVQAVYTQFLHRNADAFGLSAFVNALGLRHDPGPGRGAPSRLPGILQRCRWRHSLIKP